MPPKHEPPAAKYALAGISCVAAATVAQPIDLIKTRLQLQGALVSKAAAAGQSKYGGMVHGLGVIVREEGFFGLYKGLSPALLREATYSSMRAGMYEPVRDWLGPFTGEGSVSTKALAGAISGSIGQAIACPTDVIKVRMQASASTTPYTGILHACNDIVEKEGVTGLWRGVVPTVQRAAVITAAQFGTYDHIKQYIIRSGWLTDGVATHAASSMVAGAVATVATSPLDVIKTRMMNQRAGSAVYTSVTQCALVIARTEGLHGFYKGFIPNYMSLAPYTIMAFVFLEQLRRLCGYSSFGNAQAGSAGGT